MAVARTRTHSRVPGRPPRPVREASELTPRLAKLEDHLARALAGDFSKPLELGEEDRNDPLARITVLVRFLLDELEEAQLQRSRHVERLEELDRMKSSFVNTAAHELATPLTPIRIHMQMLRQGRVGAMSEEQQRSLAVMDRNLQRVVRLVGDMLNVARMESGAIRLATEPLDLCAVVAHAHDSYAQSARERGVALSLDVPARPIIVHGDMTRLGQVLDNVLTNAMKFTPRGGRVDIVLDVHGDQAVIRVRDTGIGLSPEQLASLFRPFVRAVDHGPHGDQGTGLGLYISKGLVERHGGLMRIESPGPGQGATVVIKLPVAQVAGSANL